MAGGGVQLATAYVSMSLRRGSVVSDTNSTLRQVERSATRSGDTAGSGFMSKFGGRLHSAASRVGHGLLRGISSVLKAGAAGAVGLLGYALTKGFQRLSSIDEATHKLTGLGNSAKQTDAIMKNALAAVKGTAFGMDEAATTAAGAVAAGVKPGKDLTRTLSLAADAATIAGTSMGDMGSIFNKVATSNKIQGDTIAQLSDKGIPIVQFLAKSLHKSSAEVVDLASKGKINFAQFQTAMQQGLGGAAQQSGDTFTGAMANVKASLGRIGANLLGGIFPHLAPSAKKLTAAMAPLEDKAKVVGDAIGKYLAKAIKRVPPIIDDLRSKWVQFKSGFDNSGALGDGATTLQKLGAAAKKVTTAFSGKSVGSGVDKAKDALSKLVKGINGKDIEKIFSGLGKSAPIFASGFNLMGKALGLVADNADTIGKYLPFILAAVVAGKAMNSAFGPNSLIGYNLRTAAMINSSIATYANAAATRAATAAENSGTAATNRGIIARTRARIATVAQTVAQRAATIATNALTVAQRLLRAAFISSPIGLVVVALIALVAGFVLAYKKSETFRRIVDGALRMVKAAAFAVVGWFTGSFVPFFTKTIPAAFQAVLNFVRAHWRLILGLITGPIGAAVILVASNWGKIRRAFAAAASWAGRVFRVAWAVVKTVLLAPITGARALISGQIALVRGIFRGLVAWGKGTLRAQWAGLKAVLTAPIEAGKRVISALLGVTGLRKVFSGAVSALGRIWGGLKSKITSPISSIVNWIGSHFINPINSLLGKLHIGLSLPWPKLAAGGVFHGGGHVPWAARASGGVLPGYSPGTDNLHFVGPAGGLSLSGGEAVMRPEWTRAVGPGFVNLMNRAARSGGVAGVRNLLSGGQAFAGGGIFGGIGRGIGDTFSKTVGGIWSGIKKVGGFALDMAKLAANPGKVLKALAGKLLGGIAGSPWGQIGKATMLRAVSGIVDKVKGAIASESTLGSGLLGVPGSAAGKGGRGWQWQWKLIHSLFPGVSLTSAYRPGARTAGSGAVSYHALGRAIDLGGSVPLLTKVAKWILANFGSRSHDLLYSPLWGRMGLYEGRWYPQPAITVAQHGNHVHWGYEGGGIFDPPVFDRGGTLAPGINVVNNRLGRPEPLVRADQVGQQPIRIEINGVPMDRANEVAKELMFAFRQQGIGKFADVGV